MKIHSMWEPYPELKKDLADVLDIINNHITLKDKKARKTVIDLLYAGGKLLRPAFLILMAKTGKNYNREQILHVAASVEVLHMASLIHDDIVDEATTRRGMPTVYSQFGTKYALYTGDYLFTVCFKILSKHASALSTIEFNTSTVERILVGELEQMNSRYNLEMSVKSYLKQISKKTAALFSLSAQMGAELSDHTILGKLNAKKIGSDIGMAFQILDDILDYTQNSFKLGKPVLEDMKQGVYSLPLIHAMNHNPESFKIILNKRENINESDASKILFLIEKYNGCVYARNIAAKYTKKAILRIQKLPDGESKKILLDITDKLLVRTN